ncbi:MAG: family 10 glycosylhydrolase [Rikenellaceae bacterium]|jgi:uncharacterized lipoprotein YddW (UPF0748 family)|nr:family 10 glycosylhydrolase [Rikenellaceae bacterium]
MKKILLCLLLIFSLNALLGQAPKREMRATWIATVDNIDWPLKGRSLPREQQADLIAILDNVVANNLNSVAFQIRPTADAFYRSDHEPWSHWLTGTQGLAPAYDPLEFLIAECDRRGIAVHVWINPYRVWLNDENLSPALRATLARRYPGWMVQYGTTHYLQPADDRSREHIVRVVADIVRKYDIDAVHIDDYFYPYRIAGQEFPDDSYFRASPRGFTDKGDWRRDNVDRIIRQIGDTIHSLKPWVEFGISPFGVWRNASRDPRGSATRAGQTNYDDLYADILKWEREGWVDYVSPQLYWSIGDTAADYKTLAQWWNDNAFGTPVYIGHALYRVDPRSSTAAWRTAQEIVRQITLNRTLPAIRGSFLYSAKFLAQSDIQSALRQVYPSRALWPINPRIAPILPAPPGSPRLITVAGETFIEWQPEQDNRRFVIYRFPAGAEPDFENPATILAITGASRFILPAPPRPGDRFFVSSLSLTHHESAPVECL